VRGHVEAGSFRGRRQHFVGRSVKDPDDVAVGHDGVRNGRFAVEQFADGLRNDRLAIARGP
jgi:hypothetical protein